MADSTKVNNIQNSLIQSVEIVANSIINSISYDKTILCTIENDENKKEGKYEVTDGSVTFTAYSQNTSYSNGTQVYVTIPNGDFENQKIIIGKKTSDIEEPFVFTTPFDTIFDLTGNLTPGANKTTILANGGMKTENDEIVSNETSNVIKAEEGSTGWNIVDEIWEPAAPAYTRLGVRADFQTWCGEVVAGEYGLKITIIGEQSEISTGTEIGKSKTAEYILYLSSNDMYGNPYNFESNYSQEKVYDISNIGKIKSIKAELYQKGNFLNSDGQLIQIQEDDFTVFDNIFVDNLYICAGYDLGTYDKEYVEIYTNDSLTYSKKLSNNEGTEVIARDENGNIIYEKDENGNNVEKKVSNKKEINMRWVHLYEDQRLDMTKYKNSTSTVEYQVHWYRYVIGAAAADEYSGVYWTKIEENISNFGLIKNGSMFFYPNVNNQIEKIKAIILVDGIPYRSNIIEFQNQEEVPNQVQAYYENALEIVTDDGTNGNYMVYGQDGKILDYEVKEDGEQTRKDLITLSLKFNGTGDLENKNNWQLLGLEDYENVTWNFPRNNTMMVYNSDETDTGCPQYKLKTYYSPSYNDNTVVATYTVNNVTYTTEKEFTFGRAGTMGTDQTIVIDFEGDQKYHNIDNKSATFVVRVYDTTGRDITEEDMSNIQWKWKNAPKGESVETILGESKTLTIKTDWNWNDNNLPILQVNVGDLETYFPIPLCNGKNYTHITGATQVIYKTDGVPEYDRSEYKLYSNNTEITGLEWGIIGGGDVYTAKLSNDKSGRLSPIDMYVDGAAVYGIKCQYWIQPILVIQNRWSSNVINQWDGKELIVNQENGVILSTAIAAGKKDSDNTFSGVMLGDWEKTDTSGAITRNTGVYGFDKGQMAYAFKDDGTAFIGKSGLGRIEFSGDSGTITSNAYESGISGMKIDLTEGTIDAYTFTLSAGDKNSKNNLIKISTEDDDYPLQVIGKTNKQASVKIGWDGTLYATNGEFTGYINSESGFIGGWSINEDTIETIDSSSNKQIVLDSNEGTILVGNYIKLDGKKSQIQVAAGNNESRGLTIHRYDNFSTPMGTVGLIQGKDAYQKPTYNVGISTEEGYGIILDSSTNMRLETSNNKNCVLELNSNNITLSVPTEYTDSNSEGYGYGKISLLGSALYCKIPAQYQYGIYARFA